MGEAAACVRELDAAHFHPRKRRWRHRDGSRRGLEATRSALFRRVSGDEPRYQFEVGFRRTEERLPDIRIDVPGAPATPRSRREERGRVSWIFRFASATSERRQCGCESFGGEIVMEWVRERWSASIYFFCFRSGSTRLKMKRHKHGRGKVEMILLPYGRREREREREGERG